MYGQFPEKLKFTAEHKQILRNLTIDNNQPGTILDDFDVMLEIFKNGKQTLTAGYQLPLTIVREINQRLKHPIQLGLQRPQQKSYPHIHGLYLLLRVSGLSYVDSSGRKPVLTIDDNACKQWEDLNPTERYCSLLEAWFLRGHADIIGEYSRPLRDLPDNFDTIARFVASRGFDIDIGIQVAGNRDIEDYLKYSPGWHNLGLLDLFGFINVRSGPPQPGERWHIDRIALTSIGAAFLALLYTEFFGNVSYIFALEDEVSLSTGAFQKVLQPYFPEWQNDLTLPEAEFREGTHIFKVSLGKVWRRIAIDAKETLAVLASAILNSVDFDQDHLYEFSYRNRFGQLEQIYHWYMQEPLISSEVLVGDLSLSVGQPMNFLFDFGDNWEFDLVLEAVEPDRVVNGAELLEAHGKAPEQYPYYDYDDDDDPEFFEDE